LLTQAPQLVEHGDKRVDGTGLFLVRGGRSRG
jgi:hypothetical protein